MNRILLTGAGGMLGNVLRQKLNGWVPNLRVSDISDLGVAAVGEEVIHGDLANMDDVTKLVDGCDGIIHLGGVSTENTFDNIIDANIRGTYNIYEAARKAGVKRILFASSNHTIGFHDRETKLDQQSPLRPDSIYGLSKCFGENLAQYYFDKFGIETVSARIGSCFAEPKNRRMLATWLSYDDFERMVKAVFNAPRVGCTFLYGASNNKEQWWDNSHASFIGWHPEDDTEAYRAKIEAQGEKEDPNDPAVRFQGGPFAAAGHFED